MDVISYLIGKKSGGGSGNNVKIDAVTYPYNSSYRLTSIIEKIDDFELSPSTLDIQYMFYGCVNLKKPPMLNTGNVKNMTYCFNYCSELTDMVLWNTSKVTTMNSMFSGCTKLANVPVLNTSTLLTANNMFSNCNSLTDESLDNILQMCINATVFSSTKTLVYLGFKKTKYSQSKFESLPHYQDFIDAGWTTGY